MTSNDQTPAVVQADISAATCACADCRNDRNWVDGFEPACAS